MSGIPSSTGMDEAFGRVLEAHRNVSASTAMASIRDRAFAVQRSALDAPFFAEMASVLCANGESEVT